MISKVTNHFAVCCILIVINIYSTPIANALCLEVTEVSGGEDHTIALTKNKTVFGCGINNAGQIGSGNQNNQYIFAQTRGGQMDTVFLERIVNIDSGWLNSIFLDIDGFVWICGSNERGQLGDNRQSGDFAYTPIRVHDGQMNTLSGYLENIINVTAGRSGTHAMAVSDPCGFVWAWGNDNNGQLGNGNGSYQHPLPVQVHGVDNHDFLRNIVLVSAGEEHSMALEDIRYGGHVFTWGDNFGGKLGIDSTQLSYTYPKQVLKGQQNGDSDYLENIVIINTGWDHCMALEKLDYHDPCYNGGVYTWGLNGKHWFSGCSGGRLGDGTTVDRSVPVRVLTGVQQSKSGFLENIIAISAGESHGMALDIFGNVWTWGDNRRGQLGIGKTQNSLTPVKVIGGEMETEYLENIVAISAGYWHCLAVDTNGVVWSWGKGINGQLGLGDTDCKNVPCRMICPQTPDNFYIEQDYTIENNNSCVSPGDPCGNEITYEISYGHTINPELGPIENLMIIDYLPKEFSLFDVTASDGGDYVFYKGTVTWTIDNLQPYQRGSVSVTIGITDIADPNGFMVNEAVIVDNKGYIYSGAAAMTPVCCWCEDGIIYVDRDAKGFNNGTSWRNAYVDLQNALQRSAAGCGSEIWVSEGIYKPTNIPDETNASFDLPEGLEIYGGFRGNENSREQRNWMKYNTVLSGIVGEQNCDNVLTVVNAADVVIDGFLVRGANKAGIYCQNSDTTIEHSIIRENGDCGIYFDKDTSTTVKNSWIHNNTGAGIYFTNGSKCGQIYNNSIVANTGYAIQSVGSLDPNVVNTIMFKNNSGQDQFTNCRVEYSCYKNNGDPNSATPDHNGNIHADPLFVFVNFDDPNSYTFLLDKDSPCIEAGDLHNTYAGQYDIKKDERLIFERVDIGAGEYRQPVCGTSLADFNNDEVVNLYDFTRLFDAWLTDSSNQNWDPCCDFDTDGKIEIDDLLFFADNWLMMTCPYMENRFR